MENVSPHEPSLVMRDCCWSDVGVCGFRFCMFHCLGFSSFREAGGCDEGDEADAVPPGGGRGGAGSLV